MRKEFEKTQLSRRLRSVKHRTLEVFGSEIRNRRRKWTVQVKQPLLIISEVQRSGGTLLSQLFDNHPECLNHPEELCWGRPQKWNWPNLELFSSPCSPTELFNKLHEPWIDAYGGAGFYRKKPGYQTRYPFLFDLTLQRQLFREIINTHQVESQRDVLDAYLTSFFSAWLDYGNLYGEDKRFVTCFTPRLIVETPIENIFNDYPDGYVVSLVRNPVDWFSSAQGHAFFRNVKSVDGLLQYWIDSTNAAVDAHKQFNSRVIVGSFESLVNQTEVAMRKLCRWIGIGYTDSLLVPSFNGIPIRSNSNFKSVYGIDKSVVRRREHAKTLDDNLVEEINELTCDAWKSAQSCFGF